MQLKKIGFLGIALLFLCYAFIWCRYDFFYENYNPAKVAPQFEAKNLRAPVYDTLVVNHFKIGYLTNRRYAYVDNYDYLGRVRNPYLVLIPENGDHVSRFLPYFLDEELNSKYHIIAIDRIGFGGSQVEKNEKGESYGPYDTSEALEENAVYATISMLDRILKNEGKHLDEGRFVFGGSTAAMGLGAAYGAYLSSDKYLMFNANLTERFKLSQWYSRAVISKVGQAIFPTNYVSKQRDLVFNDRVLARYSKSWLEGVKYTEDQENENEYSMYKGASEAKMSKILFFRGLSQSDKEKVKELTDEQAWQSKDQEVDLYQPEEVKKILLEVDDYTLDFNRIDRL